VILQSRSTPPILSFLCCIVNIFLINKNDLYLAGAGNCLLGARSKTGAQPFAFNIITICQTWNSATKGKLVFMEREKPAIYLS
jgi:hypothetical protein